MGHKFWRKNILYHEKYNFFEGTYDNQFALILVFARSLCRGEVSVYLKLHRVTIRVLTV